MTAPKTMFPITLQTLPPLTENDFNEDSNRIITDDVTGDNTTKDKDEIWFDSFLEQASSTMSSLNSITDEIENFDLYTKKGYNENTLQSTTTTNTTTRNKIRKGSKKHRWQIQL